MSGIKPQQETLASRHWSRASQTLKRERALEVIAGEGRRQQHDPLGSCFSGDGKGFPLPSANPAILGGPGNVGLPLYASVRKKKEGIFSFIAKIGSALSPHIGKIMKNVCLFASLAHLSDFKQTWELRIRKTSSVQFPVYLIKNLVFSLVHQMIFLMQFWQMFWVSVINNLSTLPRTELCVEGNNFVLYEFSTVCSSMNYKTRINILLNISLELQRDADRKVPTHDKLTDTASLEI